MNKTNKKGFTLVELLVVIAILAILATVSVVGYTAFIERATVSNDENVATQLNQFLTAMKADSTGDFYGKELVVKNSDGTVNVDKTVNAVRKAVKFAIIDSGLNPDGNLTPDSAQYDYHFYYDIEQSKIVVLADNIAIGNQAPLFKMLAKAESMNGSSNPATCFTIDGKYIFLDTNGSELADVVEGLFNLENSAKLDEIAGKLTNDSKIKEFIDNNIIVSQDGKENYKGESKANGYFVTDPSKNESGDVNKIHINASSGEKYPDSINIPDHVESIGGSVGDTNVNFEGEKNAKNLADIIEPGFTTGEINTDSGKYKFTDGTENEIKNTDPEKSDDKEYLKFNNVMSGFDIKFIADDVNSRKAYTSTSDKSGYVALDKGTFTLELTNITTQNSGFISESAKAVKWEVVSGNITHNGNGVFAFGSSFNGDSVKVKATSLADENGNIEGMPEYDANKCAKKEFEIKVVTLTAATIKYDSSSIINNNIVLVHDTENTHTFSVSGVPTYSNKIDEIVLNETVQVTVESGDCLTASENKITTTKAGTATIKVSVGGYVSYAYTVTVHDASNFAVKPKDSYLSLGNTSLTVGDIFDGTIPNGAELKIFYGLPDADYMKDPAHMVSTSNAQFKVKSNSITLGANWKTQAIEFTGESDEHTPVSFAIYHNGTRISKSISNVDIVNATNVRTYEEFKKLLNSDTLQNNVVFLADITMDADTNYFIVGGKTIYGNTFKFDIKNGRLSSEGIINLTDNGRLQDLKIIGKTYPTFASTTTDSYGSSAVFSTSDGGTIYNCYIANTRSPLRVSANVTVENSVLFGGRYSNIDIAGGATVTIKGTVTTIQQLYTADGAENVVGLGVSGWFNDYQKTVEIDNGANFVQYNFLDSSAKDYLPAVKVGTIEALDLKEPFENVFTGSAYESYLFTKTVDGNTTKYANTGIVATDKYSVNYEVTGDPTDTFTSADIFYKQGATKTVKAKTIVSDTAKFTINYDKTYFKCTTVEDTDGSVEVTGAQLKTGVVFEVVYNNDTWIKPGNHWGEKGLKFTLFDGAVGDRTSYMFQVCSDSYRTINITGADGTYNNFEYTYDEDLTNMMTIVDGLLDDLGKPTTMHGKGLHYGKMVIDANLPKPSAVVVGNLTYQDILNQYLKMGDYYTPEKFDFNSNGTLTNYWEK